MQRADSKFERRFLRPRSCTRLAALIAALWLASPATSQPIQEDDIQLYEGSIVPASIRVLENVAGTVEHLHNKLKVSFRRSNGFRAFCVTEIALNKPLASYRSPSSPTDSSDEANFLSTVTQVGSQVRTVQGQVRAASA